MATSLRSSGVTASLVVALMACSLESASSYVPPINAASYRGRSRGSSAMLSMASELRTTGATSGSSSQLPYIRIQKRGRHYDVQTAITTFQTKNELPNNGDAGSTKGTATTTVDLHAQIHFGDASYFQYFNDDTTFGSRYDKILYELIVENKFLSSSSSSNTLKQLQPMSPESKLNPIAPTQSDRSTASQYGLQCQVDGIQYCREGWVHADLTREEFLEILERGDQQHQQQQSSSSPGKTITKQKKSQQQPLWALASTSATYPGSELVTSLVRPLTTSSNSASAALTRRLFTHLFLPGDALSGWIRAALWLGVPSPELSILLVDWSSLSYVGRQTRRRGGRGGGGVTAKDNIAPISPIAAPVFLSLLTGNWGTARRLVFGQVLVGGQNSADNSKGGVLIEKRNQRAMDVLRDSLSDDTSATNANEDPVQNQRIALLYGAGHCRDLHRRLVQEENMTPVRTEWRTAFRATAPRWGDFVNTDDWKVKTTNMASNIPSSTLIPDGEDIVKSMSVSTLESVAVGLVILPLYLLVGGFDWVSTVGDFGNALDRGMYLDGVADVLLYLVRHVALYVGISKFVVDWGGSEGIFEEDERA